MPKQTKEFIWWESPSHIELLGCFDRPVTLENVIEWRAGSDLKEPIRSAISRIIQDQAIRPCTLEETARAVMKAPDLKAMCKERGLKATGTKDEVLASLLDVDRAAVENRVQGETYYYLSSQGEERITTFRKRKKAALIEAHQKVRDLVAVADFSKASKVFRAYNQAFETQWRDGFAVQFLPTLKRKLIDAPKVLLERYSLETVKQLQLAMVMKFLWGDLSIGEWLPEGFGIPPNEIQTAIDLLDRYHTFLWRIPKTDIPDEMLVILFSDDDVQVCDSCKKLHQTCYYNDQLPAEWPFPGCMNPIGCLPDQIRWESSFYDDLDDLNFLEELHSQRKENGRNAMFISGVKLESLQALRELQEMLDEELISEEDFEKKKAKILAKM